MNGLWSNLKILKVSGVRKRIWESKMSKDRDLHSIKVEISGDTYLLKSDKNPEHVAAIAKYVNDKIRTFTIKSAVKSPTKIAVLAALNISEELLELREKYAKLIGQLELYEKQSKDVSDTIDEVLSDSVNSN